MSHQMTRGGVCGRPDGHNGQHLSPEVQTKNLARVRRWKIANPERNLEARRRRYAANPEKYRAARRRLYAADPVKEREAARRYYAAFPEKARESRRKWYAANPEKSREYKQNPENRLQATQLARRRRAAQAGEEF